MSQTTTTTVLNLYGNRYTVETVAGKIVRVACAGRWPLSDVRFIGDEWLIATLQEAVEVLTPDDEE